METGSDKNSFSVKERIEYLNKNPDLLLLFLLQKDPIVRTLYKRPKKKVSNVGDLSLKNRLLLMKENPGIRFNRELWCSLKESLMRYCEDENDKFSSLDKQVALAGDSSFFMWLLNTVGLSPHHTRQMLRYYLKSLELVGKSIHEWTVDDVFDLMIRRFKKGQGGAREIFELSRLFWLYMSDQARLESLITRVMDLTGVSE